VWVVPFRGWQRVAVVALLVLPFVLVVVPVMLVVLVSSFLGDARRKYVLDLLNALIGWARVITGTGANGPDGLTSDGTAAGPTRSALPRQILPDVSTGSSGVPVVSDGVPAPRG
jgi:hypothetical protein